MRQACVIKHTNWLTAKNFSNASAPSKARLCQSGVGPDPGSPGQAPGTECCVVSGNAGGAAYPGSARAAMRKREGIEPRYEKNRGCRRASYHGRPYQRDQRPGSPRTHRGRRPWHVTKAASGTREILWVLPSMGVGWHNRHTGRKPDTPEEVGCLHMSDEVG